MSQLVVTVGAKLHVVQRRLFQEDVRRHYVGQVTAISDTLVRMAGHTFVHNPSLNEYERREERRTRIFGLGDANLIVNVLPETAELDSVRYELQSNRMVITDGTTFSMDVNEFGLFA